MYSDWGMLMFIYKEMPHPGFCTGKYSTMFHQTQFPSSSMHKNHLHFIHFLRFVDLQYNSKIIRGGLFPEKCTPQILLIVFNPFQVLHSFNCQFHSSSLFITTTFQKWNVFFTKVEGGNVCLFQLVGTLCVSELHIPHMIDVGGKGILEEGGRKKLFPEKEWLKPQNSPHKGLLPSYWNAYCSLYQGKYLVRELICSL